MREAFLDVPHRVGASGKGGELAGRERRRNGDKARARRRGRGSPCAAVGRDRRPIGIEAGRLGDRIAEAEPDHLGRVGDRATADRHDQIRARVARGVRGRDHVGARRVRADLARHPGAAIAQHRANALDHVGVARERAARQHIDRARLEPIDLAAEHVGKGLPVDHPIHLRITIDTALHATSGQ